MQKLNAHTKPIFKKIHVLTIHDINKLQTAFIVYKAIDKLLHHAFQHYMLPTREFIVTIQEKKYKLHLFSHRLNIRKHSIRHYGTHIWNSLTSYITETKSLNIFKKRYQKYLLSLLWMEKWCIVACTEQLYFDLFICINCIHTFQVFLSCPWILEFNVYHFVLVCRKVNLAILLCFLCGLTMYKTVFLSIIALLHINKINFNILKMQNCMYKLAKWFCKCGPP